MRRKGSPLCRKLLILILISYGKEIPQLQLMAFIHGAEV